MSLMKDRACQLSLDAFGEGGLTCELDRFPMVDQPTLIIGLGGTGIDAMLEFKRRAQRSFTAPEGKQLPGRLAFIAVDADPQIFTRRHSGKACIEERERLDIFEPHIGEYLAHPQLVPQAYLRGCLSGGVNIGGLCCGTGAVRQLGRFMFINRAQAYIDRISRAVAGICSAGGEGGEAFPADGAVNVYILTGVCGGTGSGAFLDAAYLARHTIENRLGKRARVRGFIFTPDVNLLRAPYGPMVDMFCANGYAALQELDFWMNRQRGRNFVQQYTGLETVDTPEAPFDDLCCLVCAPGRAAEDYDGAMGSAAEALVCMLSAPAAGEAWVGGMLDGVAAALRRSGRDAGFMSVGTAAAQLPADRRGGAMEALLLRLRAQAVQGIAPLQEGFSPDGIPGLSLLLLPAGEPGLVSAAADWAANRHVPLRVAPLRGRGGICWMQLAAGFPLRALRGMAGWKERHDACAAADHHRGRYLNMGPGENWLELLPSLMPEAAAAPSAEASARPAAAPSAEAPAAPAAPSGARPVQSGPDARGAAPQIEAFADALVHGLYKPAAPRIYVLDGGEGEGGGHRLMSIQDYSLAPSADPFYALFRKYCSLDGALKAQMHEIVQRRRAEADFSDPALQRGHMLARQILAATQKRVQEIRLIPGFRDHEIMDFYMELQKRLALCM